jgi:glycosyltransferase involved in cell wall biosynthesis
VPVYQELARICPGAFEVWFATDCSARGYFDPGFGCKVRWQQPILEGFPHRVLHNTRGEPLQGCRSLHGRGLFSLLKEERPSAVLFTSFLYEYDWIAWLGCLRLGLPVWIRQETQDNAFRRAALKSLIRRWIYCWVYRSVVHAFYIGELNRQHLLRHGVSPTRLTRCPYCVADPLSGLTRAARERLRSEVRAHYGFGSGACVVAFVGKLIPKKDPILLVQAVQRGVAQGARGLRLWFIGGGPLETQLRRLCSELALPVSFAGFVNQDRLPSHYLAADIVALPSREGETWGLVINEALQAGCAVAMSQSVGCAAEFGGWERCRTFPVGDADACTGSLDELSGYPRDFDWARAQMRGYSVLAAAQALARQLA